MMVGYMLTIHMYLVLTKHLVYLITYLFSNHICHLKVFPSGGHLIPMNIHPREEDGS